MNLFRKNIKTRFSSLLERLESKESETIIELEYQRISLLDDGEDMVLGQYKQVLESSLKHLPVLREKLDSIVDSTCSMIAQLLDELGVKEAEKSLAYKYFIKKKCSVSWQLPSTLLQEQSRNLSNLLYLVETYNPSPPKLKLPRTLPLFRKQDLNPTEKLDSLSRRFEASNLSRLYFSLREIYQHVKSHRTPNALVPTMNLTSTYQSFDGLDTQKSSWLQHECEEENYLKSIVVSWPDGNRVLTFDVDGGFEGTLKALKKAYGANAQRELLAVMNFLFFARKKPEEKGWVFISELCQAAGIDNQKKNREKIKETLSFLEKVELEVKYAKGQPLTGKLLCIRHRQENAFQVDVHRALYQCLVEDSGSMGKYFIVCPWAILQKVKIHEKILLVYAKVAEMIRATFVSKSAKPRKAHITMKNLLAETFNLREKDKRKSHTREEKELVAMLDLIAQCGGFEYKLLEGKNSQPTFDFELPKENQFDELPVLPQTGEELSKYIKENNLNPTKLGRILNVDRGSVVSNLKLGPTPLQTNFRKKLVQAKWPWFYHAP